MYHNHPEANVTLNLVFQMSIPGMSPILFQAIFSNYVDIEVVKILTMVNFIIDSNTIFVRQYFFIFHNFSSKIIGGKLYLRN